jgi:hypothetical protein
MSLSKQLRFHAAGSRRSGNHATAIFCEQAADQIEVLEAFRDDAFEAHSNIDLDIQRLRDLRKLQTTQPEKEQAHDQERI